MSFHTVLTLKRKVRSISTVCLRGEVREGGGEVDLETEGWNRKINTLPNNLVACLG